MSYCREKNKKSGQGFTLIELMIVVAIIGILAAVALPKFSQMLEKSREGATKGNLAAIRSAVTIYYAEKEGTWPGDLTTAFTGYLYPIPPAKATPLGNVNTVFAGNVFANSIATDTKGSSFTTY